MSDSLIDKILSGQLSEYDLDPARDTFGAGLHALSSDSGGGASFDAVFQSLLRWRFNIGLDSPSEFLSVVQMGAPGQATLHDNEIDIFLRAPIASDVWYFSFSVTVVPYYDIETGSYDDTITNEVLSFIEPMLSYYGGVKPLKAPYSSHDITDLSNNGRYTIKQVRYENTSPLHGFRHPGYPDRERTIGEADADMDNYLAYFAIPVGPLGVMQTVSLIFENPHSTLLSSPSWDSTVEVKEGTHAAEYGGLIPHECDSSDNSLSGIHIVESLYLLAGDNVEFPSPDFVGFPRHYEHQWLRYYVPLDAVFPMPGTFVGVLCKASPNHCWWFQETNPFLYAGNWFETKYYTTGVVESVIEDADEITLIYAVRVRGFLIHLRSSDFLRYDIGSRVAILKVFSPPDSSFTWAELDDIRAWLVQVERDISPKGYTVHPSYTIVPAAFYQEV